MSDSDADEISTLFAREREPMSLDVQRALEQTEALLFDRKPSPLTLGRYVVRGRLGAGGHGVVHAAYDPELDRRVAIKLVRSGTPAGDEALVAEARAASRISHANVVPIFDAGRYDKLDLARGSNVDLEVPEAGVFLVMELLEGGDLGTWVTQHQPAWSAIVARYCDVGTGLAAAHARDVVHLDFKPGNVLLTADGTPKVTDFGMARAPAMSSGRDGGTLAFMAPEQHDGRPEAASDQFAFCASLVSALTGAMPFEGDTPTELLTAKCAGPPTIVAPRVPERVLALLRVGLHPNPRRRHESMEDLVEALRRTLTPRWRMPAVITGVAAVALVIGAGLTRAPPDPCLDVGDELSSAWNDSRRSAMLQRFAESDAPWAEALSKRVLEGFDERAEEWRDARRHACENDPQAKPSLCLSAARVRLGEAARRLIDDDGAPLVRAHEVLDDLPRVAECDASTLGSGSELADMDELLEIERLILASRISADAAEKRAVAAEAVQRAEAHRDSSVYPRALMALAGVTDREGELEEKAAILQRAAASAERIGDDATVARAWGSLAFLRGRKQHRFDEGRALIDLAIAKTERAQLGWWILARTYSLRASIEGEAGEPAVAQRYVDLAQQLFEANDMLGHPTYDELLATRVRTRFMLGDDEGGAALARELYDRLRERIGEDHPSTLRARGDLGVFIRRQGHYAEALAIHRDVLRRFVAYDPTGASVVDARGQLGTSLYFNGLYEEAAEQRRKVLEGRMAILGPDDAAVGNGHWLVGSALREIGDLVESRQQLMRALAIADARETAGDDFEDIEARTALAFLEIREGALDAADARVEEVLALRPSGLPEPRLTLQLDALRAELACRRGRFEEGLRYLDDAVLVEPHYAALHAETTARCLALGGDPEGARQAAATGREVLERAGVEGRPLDRLDAAAREPAWQPPPGTEPPILTVTE